MKPIKFETIETLKCPNCGEIVYLCDKCNCVFYLELGCEFDGFCDEDNFKHICKECNEEKMDEK